jgi:hypothetical protein
MGQYNYRITESIVSSGSSGPLSGAYYEAGSVDTSIYQVFPAGGAVQLVSAAWGIPGQVAGAIQAIELLSNQNLTIQTNFNGTIGVQTITIGGSPTGGTFVLGFQGQITSAIAYNGAASAVQSALRTLSTIGGTNVTCTGGPLPGSAVTCTFSGPLITKTVPLLTSNISGLTGGTPTIAIANAAAAPQDVLVLSANIPFLWSISPGYFPYPFAGAVTALYVTNTNACSLQGRILTY